MNGVSKLAGCVVAGSIILAACGLPAPPNSIQLHANARAQSREQGVSPRITVAPNQTSNGFKVVIDSVSLPEGPTPRSGGFVAIASDVGNKPGDILGYAKVGETTTRNLNITLASQVTTGRYFFLLYSGSTPPREVGSPVRSTEATITVA